MTSGTKGSQREKLLIERDERLVEKMKQGRSIRAIAIDEGLEHDYAGKICAALARTHGLDYCPEGKRQQHTNTIPPGLSDATNRFRRTAATKFYLWALKNKKHPLEVCRDTGLTQAAQRAVTKAHGPFDWHLSNLDRWSHALGVSFEELLLDLTFDPETAARMKKCLPQTTD